MVKHIVMFQLKDTLSMDEKLDVMNRCKAAIEAERFLSANGLL